MYRGDKENYKMYLKFWLPIHLMLLIATNYDLKSYMDESAPQLYHIKSLYILTIHIIQLANSLSSLLSSEPLQMYLLGLVVFMVSSGKTCVNSGG